MNEKDIFAMNLNYYMERSGKTQADLIAELGVNKSTISTWCNGVKMPRMGTIQTLADYFGIMKSDLIEEKKPAPKDELSTEEALRHYFVQKLGRLPSSDELRRLDDFAETFIKGLNK